MATEPQRVRVFPDCNALLHFQTPDQFLWDQLLGTRDVEVVVSQTLLGELDTKSWGGTDAIRPRAKDRRAWLMARRKASDFTLGGGGTLSFATARHGLSMEREGLNPQSGDDNMLAEVISSQRSNPGVRHVLLTADSTLQTRAPAFGVDTMEPPADLSAPLSDDARRQIRKLNEEIQRLQHKAPRLQLQFDEGGEHRVPLPARRVPSDDEVAAQLAAARRDHLYIAATDSADLQYSAKRSTWPGHARFEAYNESLDRYFADLERYVREGFLHDPLTFEIPVELHNSGGAPAEDISVTLAFPPGVFIMEREIDFARKPHPPTLPDLEGLFSYPGTPPEYPDFAFPELSGPNWGPKIEPSESGTEVSYARQRLTQHKFYRFTLFGQFDDASAAKSFQIFYSLISASLPDRQEGSLNVVLVPAERDGGRA